MRRPLDLIYGLYAGAMFCAVIFLFVSPLIVVMPTLAMRRGVGRLGVRLAMLAIGLPLRVRGLGNLPAETCLVCANHASYLDGLVLTAALPSRFNFVVQDGAAGWPVVGLVIRRMGVTFINRAAPREAARQTRALIRRLRNGESLVVFPEGTFKREAALLPFRNGAFLMAARAKVPVVPVAIRGTRRLFGADDVLPHYSPVEIRVLPPLRSGGDAPDPVHHLRDGVRDAVLAECGEPDARAAGA